MSDTPAPSSEVDRIHSTSKPLLDMPCDLLDVERRVIEVAGHKMLAIDLWFSPVFEDEPIHYLGLIADPDGALKVHLLSPEQYAAHFTNNAEALAEAPTEQEPSNG